MMENRAKLFAALAIATIAYLCFSSPGEIVVNETGDIKGLLNIARSTLQGKSFWKDQLLEIHSALQQELSEPQRQAELDREMNQMRSEVDETMAEMYREHPDTRPSPEERRADALREQADQIEQREIDLFLEKMRLERIAELQKILPIVQAKGE